MAPGEEDAVMVSQCPCYKAFLVRYKRLHGVELASKRELKSSAPSGVPQQVLSASTPNSQGSVGFMGLENAPSMDISTDSGGVTIERIIGRLEEGESRVDLLDKKLDKLLQMFQAMVVGTQFPGETPGSPASPKPEPALSL